MFRKSLISYTHIRNPVNWEWNAGVHLFFSVDKSLLPPHHHQQKKGGGSRADQKKAKAKGCGQSQNQGSELNLNGRTKREE